MESIHSILPDPEILLTMEPEELAGVVIQYLNSLPDGHPNLNRYNFGLPHIVEEYPGGQQKTISRALMEAWSWLEREGLLIPTPGRTDDWFFVSRRGKQIVKSTDLASYRKANILPKYLLHPAIAHKVWATFLRGDYDIAVLQAFREVEITVRKAGGFTNSDIGKKLMHDAFHKDNGPLTDMSLDKGEREAIPQLFAGAIGLYKNPSSHREEIDNPEDAAKLIVFASHLLDVVDSRSNA